MSENTLMAIVLVGILLFGGLVISIGLITDSQTARFCVAAGNQWVDGDCKVPGVKRQ